MSIGSGPGGTLPVGGPGRAGQRQGAPSDAGTPGATHGVGGRGPRGGAAENGTGAGAPDPAVAALRALAADQRVVDAEEALREASTELRWNEALRRRWREARAEAAVRGAIASGGVEGAVLPVDVLRDAVASRSLTEASTGDPSLDAVAGLWRAGTRLNGWMPDLRGEGRPAQPSPRTLLTALHRDVAGPLAVTGTIPLDDVAAPRRGERVPLEGGPGEAPAGDALYDRLDGVLRLIDAAGAPALVRAAVVHAEMVCARPFTAGNAAVGRLLVRHLITRDGLEPTGVAVVDRYAGRVPVAYADALAAYATGTLDGVVAWVVWQAEAVLVGIQEAQAICRSVQAGTTRA